MIWSIKILQNRRFERSVFTLRGPAPFMKGCTMEEVLETLTRLKSTVNCILFLKKFKMNKTRNTHFLKIQQMVTGRCLKGFVQGYKPAFAQGRKI